MDPSIFTNSETYVSLFTLTAMEVVLGIDNVVFISILADKLPPEQRAKARRVGLILALGMRLGLLFAISWVMGLTEPWFAVWGKPFSGRDLILLVGGLFLIGKSTHEIYDKLEVVHPTEGGAVGGRSTMTLVLAQIVVLDIVFSLDSVITAVGMAEDISIMVIAMLGSVGVMLVFAGSIGEFVTRHPSMKVLALSFLTLIGAMLVAEGWGHHVGKGYIYVAMAFSLLVELLNMRYRKRQAPVQLHHRFENDPGDQARPLP
ncbi:MAG: TerC family protein [Deltaproteobacteria bacterium]|nr:TerC family protein [Nannocystaceae bacterium]